MAFHHIKNIVKFLDLVAKSMFLRALLNSLTSVSHTVCTIVMARKRSEWGTLTKNVISRLVGAALVL